MSVLSLYDSIGGSQTFEKVIDVFYDKVLADELVGPMFEGVDMNKQKAMLLSFLAHVFGNAEYNGRSMRSAHHRMVDITDRHFDAVKGHLEQTLIELGVDEATRNKILAVTETTRNDVIGRSEKQALAIKNNPPLSTKVEEKGVAIAVVEEPKAPAKEKKWNCCNII